MRRLRVGTRPMALGSGQNLNDLSSSPQAPEAQPQPADEGW